MNDKIRLDNISKNYSIYQYEDYYSMSTDSFLLPYFSNIPKKNTKKIADLCAGNGVISIIMREKTEAQIDMIEIQEKMTILAQKSIEYNNIKNVNITNIDLKEANNYYKPSTFDYVICNPPYFPLENMPNKKEKTNHSISRHEILVNLSDIVKCIKYLLKQNGKFSIVHRTYRIIDILSECNKQGLAIKRIRFVYSKKSSDNSKIVLLEGNISKVNDVKIEQPLYIYNEDGTYTDEMKIIYGI